MSEDVPILGIPALRENPFKARPLERGQSNMLIGRDEISARWTRFLKARTARMVLLIGEWIWALFIDEMCVRRNG